MEITVFVFLAGGLFLGWSLGANDAANVFGTAVGTRMVRFGTAALICSVFVILGAVISGAGAAHTLGKLGAINALAGSAVAAAAAAFTVYGMTRLGIPVSTSQAIVGAIVGWNLFSGFPTDSNAFAKIVITWVACPILAAAIAAVLFKLVTWILSIAKIHLLRQDAYTRLGLILAGALGAYSLGANNIANVMGVFLPGNPFSGTEWPGLFHFSGVQKLFLIGAIAIAVGVFTYSRRVMMTVGQSLLPMSPVAAFVVVVAHSIVLLLFASQSLEAFLAGNGLPTIPLVPVSSSQAVIGGVIGIGLLKGGKGIRWRVLGGIASGWVTTPLIAGVICFVALFVMQNVFSQPVYRDHSYQFSEAVTENLKEKGLTANHLASLSGRHFSSTHEMNAALEELTALTDQNRELIVERAALVEMEVAPAALTSLRAADLEAERYLAIASLAGRRFSHVWQLEAALANASPTWRLRAESIENKIYNRDLQRQLDLVTRILSRPAP